jgi:hypothetical protein
MAARLDCRHIAVNEKMFRKTGISEELLPKRTPPGSREDDAGLNRQKFALQLFA